MVSIQEGVNENLFVTVPSKLARGKGWKKGDELAFMIVGDGIVPQTGDILLKRVRNG